MQRLVPEEMSFLVYNSLTVLRQMVGQIPDECGCADFRVCAVLYVKHLISSDVVIEFTVCGTTSTASWMKCACIQLLVTAIE